MSVIEDFTAWYQNLPRWAQIGIPIAGAAGVAYIVLRNRNSTGLTATGNTLPASGSGGGGSAGGGGSTPAPVITPFPSPTGGGTPGPGSGGTPINYSPSPSVPAGITPNPYASAPQTVSNPYGAPSTATAQIQANNPYNASSVAVSSAAQMMTTGPVYMSVGSWGAPISLASPSNDAYVLAQQEYYALQNPSAIPAGSVFAAQAAQTVNIGGKTESGLQFQFGQAVGGIQGSGAAYYGGYPAIPSSVLGSASSNPAYTSAYNASQSALISAGTYIPLTPATTYQGTATGSTPTSTPGVTINSAAQKQLAGYITTYQNIPVSQQTTAQKTALATDLATYQRQYGSYPA